ncbi:MAG: LytTR family DNA-binding domain-containing protein [Oscillospiraceae bacterium]|nr:LytTR family DNA-binding domain-containing protein [Oscillospiraceae bacterium]
MPKTHFILCDDNADDLESLRESVEDYIASRGISGETLCFSSPEELLKFSEQKLDGKEVYLLDVVMPEVDGIDLGRKLRERGANSAVIYTSTSKEYALDAFEVHAFSYLIKPFSSEKLFAELDGCLGQITPPSQTISVKTVGGIVGVDAAEIIAVEYYAHRLTFHFKNGKTLDTVYKKQPFNVQAEELIKTGYFVRVSASYLVNIKKIRGLKTDEFIMCDGSRYKITRKFSAARRQYIEGEMQNGDNGVRK